MSSSTLARLGGIALSGLFFGAGLVLSGMSHPGKVIGFLDLAAIFTGSWDPTLLFVLGGAVATTFIGYQLVWKRGHPLYAPEFLLPRSTDLDAPLLTGTALFGIGWGLAGYCPGPALANMVNPSGQSLTFMLAMLIGMLFAKGVQHFLNQRKG